MIKAENLSYSFPHKELYNKISFTLEDDVHCAFIGTNGTGKSTLVNMILHPEEYLYDGKLIIDVPGRIGYVSQFYTVDEEKEVTVFDYLSEEFVRLQDKINQLCEEMGVTEHLEEVMEEYQTTLDEFNAIDGDFYESNIHKQLKVAGLAGYEDQLLTSLSGGEFKLVQAIREMMISPKFIIMDEPDVFLDFGHLNALCDLINSHKGTLLVITHNRYLLNHCFNKILHLENTEMQEFDGNYVDYNFALLQMKIEQQQLAAADMEEIERNRKIVERLRNSATAIDSATRGRSLHARVSLLERLEARKTRSPFVDIKQPKIVLHAEEKEEGEGETVLQVEDYNVTFDREIMEHVSFSLQAGEKVAIVGPNGTGKTTLLRDIMKGENPAIRLGENVKMAYLSQMHGEVFDEKATVLKNFEDAGFDTDAQVISYLETYGFEKELIYSPISELSGGEKNLLQLAKISRTGAGLLLLDEPTSHLDTYSQLALEQAIADYNGTVLMASHDFYTVANCMDYVLLTENKGLRKVSMRKFRKMIYADHFDKDYLEYEQKKKELENRIAFALQAGKYEDAKRISEDLEKLLQKYNG
ncbi:ABC-F family ATP-binding cassette domain-containing protein [Blautia sp. HCP3S3_H10_1]|uniref:ABC-F family ATP-binding cassette domain-containing protein n=1 Tax=unclassified Blautia TaxID=2648079 RepID=UPI003F90F735